MKKRVIYDKRARAELEEFSREVQKDFQEYIVLLETKGNLRFPGARKMARNLFEIRVQHEGAYRGFYLYAKGDVVIMLHFFQKKTQKTPQRNIQIAQQRAKNYG